jgi:hypothetical protein
VNADIGKRTVVERHQFMEGALAPPPVSKAVAGGNNEIDQRHGSTPHLLWCIAKMGSDALLAKQNPCIAAMRKVRRTDAFTPDVGALQQCSFSR